MTENNVFYACVCKHCRRNFACICSAFLKIHIFCTESDFCAFYCLCNGNYINRRNAEHNVYLVCINKRHKHFRKCNSLRGCLIHFPVSCYYFFTHGIIPSIIYRQLRLHREAPCLQGIQEKHRRLSKCGSSYHRSRAGLQPQQNHHHR